MPMSFYCFNYENCRNYVYKFAELCDKCKEDARKLQDAIRIEDTPQYLSKNEGLRRHVKASWWKKGSK